MGFFDFLTGHANYPDTDVARMNLRHRFLIAPFAEDINGSRVLDLAAHDGRWSLGFAGAGAREVIGVEARQSLVDRFADFAAIPQSQAVSLVQGDIYADLDARIAAGEQFSVVGVLGIFYHIMDHYGLLARISQMNPKLIIIDSEFITSDNPTIQLVKERTDNDLNATGHVPAQETTLIGIPSTKAMERMAEVLGYHCFWLDWDHLPEAERISVADYYRDRPKKRRTCFLRPMLGD